jgi:hypothetical protein
VTGFLRQQSSFSLSDVEIQSKNDYATVLIVSMDDKPLKDSTKILLQVGTTERPAGWTTKPAQVASQPGEEVVNFGHAPWMIARADVMISLKNTHISRAQVLDPNGMPIKNLPLQNTTVGKSLLFPPDALYVILQ